MALRRRIQLRRQRAIDAPDVTRSLVGVMASLRVLEDVTNSEFLMHMFRRVPGDDKRWRVMWATKKPDMSISQKVDALEDEIVTFAEGIRQGAQGATQAVLKLSLSEEAKLGRKILGTSAKLHMQIVRLLKPAFAAQETFIEKRRKVPMLNIRTTTHAEIADMAVKTIQDESKGAAYKIDESLGIDDEEAIQLCSLEEANAHARFGPVPGTPAPAVAAAATFALPEGDEENKEQLQEESEIRTKNEDVSAALSEVQLEPNELVDWLQQYRDCIQGTMHIVDLYLLATQCHLVSLAISELMEQPRVYSSAMAAMTMLSSQFVRLGLPLFEQLFCQVDKGFVKDNIFPLSFIGIHSGSYWQPARQLIRKLSLFDDILTSLDILILPARINAHDGGIKAVSCAHLCPAYIATGGADATLRLWDTQSGTCKGQFVGHESCITWLSFSQYDTHLFSTSFDGTLRIWNTRTAVCEQVLRGHHDAILQGAVTKDYRRLATASIDSTVRVWDSRTGRCTHVLNGHQGWVKCVAFGLHGHTVISGGLDRKVHMWQLSGPNGPIIKYTIHNHRDFILDVATCISHNLIITCSKDQTIKVWTLTTGTLERDLKSSGWVRTLEISPDDNMVATGSFDNCISIFRIRSGRLLRRLRVHNSGILKIAWVSNRTLICACIDGFIQMIDI